MTKTTLRLSLFCLLAVGAPARAASSGSELFNFLFLDANARAVAMGGAYTALANDSNALLYNPAGLGKVSQHEATFMHNQYFAGITQEYIGFAARQGLGFNLNYLNSGHVARTTLANPSGAGLAYTGLQDWALGTGYGRSLGPDLALGAGVKLIHETNAGTSAQGYAFDLGALYALPMVPGLSLGLSFQNMGPVVKFHNTKEHLPFNYRAGAAYVFTALDFDSAVSLDVTKESNENILVAFGAETVISKMMALRLGFNNRNTVGTGITGGIGWFYKNYSLDFAVVTYGPLGLTHRASATVRWGGESQRPARRQEAPKEEAREADEPGPEQVRALDRAGYNAWLKKDIQNAKASFLQSVEMAEKLSLKDSKVAETYAKLGLCWVTEGNPSEAADAFNKGLNHNPSEGTRRFIQEQLRKLEAR